MLSISIVFSGCASHKDKVFTEVDEVVPEKIEREIELPADVRAKFQVSSSPKEVSSTSEQESEKSKKVAITQKVAKEQIGPTQKNTKLSKLEVVKQATPAPLSAEELKKRSQFKSWDLESKRVWDKFSPFISVGEEMIFEISFFGVLAGHVRLSTKPETTVGGRKAYHFNAQLKSGRWYDFIYKLDDYIDTYVDSESFRPIKYTLIQRESSQKVDDLQLFDFESSKTYLDYYRLKDGKEKKENKEEPIPHFFQDSYSALPFMRGVKMKIGDIHQFPIVTRGKIWLLKYEVVGVEEVKVQGEWIQALKIKAETQFPGVLERKGDILFWFDQSDLKRPVKFQAKVKIGTIEGILTDYSPGKIIK